MGAAYLFGHSLEPDEYNSSNVEGGFVVGNLFKDDSDIDMGPNDKSNWTAVIVDAFGNPASSPDGLEFLGDAGAFRYDTSAGSVTFYYIIDPGDWTDGTNEAPMSADSNVARVDITLGYVVTVEAMKPRAKLGSAVQIDFQVKTGGNVVSDLAVVVRIESVYNGSGTCVASSDGPEPEPTQLYPPEGGDTGNSDLRFLDTAQGFRLNWDTTVGTERGPGCYTVLITLDDQVGPYLTPNVTQLR